MILLQRSKQHGPIWTGIMLCEKGPSYEIQELPKRHTECPTIAVHIIHQEISPVSFKESYILFRTIIAVTSRAICALLCEPHIIQRGDQARIDITQARLLVLIHISTSRSLTVVS